MSRIAQAMKALTLTEGFSESPLSGVRFFKHTCHIPRTPLVYDPGICIVAQGRKVGYIGDRTFQYDADQYLVVPVFMQFECETFASPELPLLGIYMDIHMSQLHELISQLDPAGEKSSLGPGIGPALLDDNMADAVLRLLNCFSSPKETRVLGPGLVREILFRALCGSQAPMIYALALHNSQFSRVARTLEIIQNQYKNKLDVERLAQEAGMSISAYHRAFKKITTEPPMQYLKKVRLTRAKEILLQGDTKAYIAAEQVGYESASQFSREFKRYFGQSPAQMIVRDRVGPSRMSD
jgi:AraC-like DNA-binding protein